MMRSMLPMFLLLAQFTHAGDQIDKRTTYFNSHMNIIFPLATATDKDYIDARTVVKANRYGALWSSYVQNSPRNPNCCFWMELWRHDSSAYLLRIGPWGGHLTAGSPDALKAALAYMDSLRGKTKNGDPTYPLGIYSNAKFHTVKADTVFNVEGNSMVTWPNKWPVHMLDPAVSDRLTVEMTPVLNEFAKEFGFAPVVHAGVNPENCLWLEHWAYSPNSWVLRISDSAPGAHITAGSTAKLQEALAFIRKNAKKSEQGWVLPVGNFTNLTVQDTGKGPPK